MKLGKLITIMTTLGALPLQTLSACPKKGDPKPDIGTTKKTVTISGTAFETKCRPLTLQMFARDENTDEKQDLVHVADSLDISYVLRYDSGHRVFLSVTLKTAAPNCTGWVKVQDGPANKQEVDIVGRQAVIQDMRLVR